jgi:hypothetical protein
LGITGAEFSVNDGFDLFNNHLLVEFGSGAADAK